MIFVTERKHKVESLVIESTVRLGKKKKKSFVLHNSTIP